MPKQRKPKATVRGMQKQLEQTREFFNGRIRELTHARDEQLRDQAHEAERRRTELETRLRLVNERAELAVNERDFLRATVERLTGGARS